jgi:hypothetical protein
MELTAAISRLERVESREARFHRMELRPLLNLWESRRKSTGKRLRNCMEAEKPGDRDFAIRFLQEMAGRDAFESA